jgi:hypothetical protein
MKRQKHDAETLALKALAFLASDEEAMGGFLGRCGADIDTVRTRATDPEFLGFVLDHLLTEDEAVLAFAASEQIDPMDVVQARAALPGGDTPNWT